MYIYQRWHLIAGLLLISGGIVLAQPKLEIDGGTERYLGEGDAGKFFCDTLIVKNTGTSVLHIIHINKTCGCTTVFPDTNIIPAAQHIRVIVKISPPDQPDEIDRSIAILTNDLTNPVQVVDFKFRIRLSVGFKPPHSLAFSGCRVNIPCVASVTIMNETDTAFALNGVTMNMHGLRALSPGNMPIAPHDSIHYRVELTADSTGYRTGTMKIMTTSGMNPSQEFTVYANVANADGTLPPVIHSNPQPK